MILKANLVLMNKKNIPIFSTAILIVIIDQSTKFLIKKNFQLNQSLPIIKNILHFTYITNTGSAFGLFKGFNYAFVIISLIVIGIIFYHLRKIKKNETALQISVGLLLGGSIGNLIDRLYYSAVIDFIDFRIWPIFNIADSAVTISIVILIFIIWKK